MDALIAATAEMVRVVKPSGSIWVNLGDCYRAGSLALIPARYAIAAADRLGLTVRGEVIWSKHGKGFIDARAKGRVRKTHEYWFHLTTGKECTSTGATRVSVDNSTRPQRIRAEQLLPRAGSLRGTARLFEPLASWTARAVGSDPVAAGRLITGGWRWRPMRSSVPTTASFVPLPPH